MKLLLDEMISGEVAVRLRDRGHDVTAVVVDQGLKSSSDPAVFAAAQEQGRAVVTYNRPDFEPIVRALGEANRTHCGLVIVNPRRFPNDQFTRLVDALDELLNGPELQPGFTTWLRS